MACCSGDNSGVDLLKFAHIVLNGDGLSIVSKDTEYQVDVVVLVRVKQAEVVVV